jgi:phosphorylcholine metabolism protein LicD
VGSQMKTRLQKDAPNKTTEPKVYGNGNGKKDEAQRIWNGFRVQSQKIYRKQKEYHAQEYIGSSKNTKPKKGWQGKEYEARKNSFSSLDFFHALTVNQKNTFKNKPLAKNLEPFLRSLVLTGPYQKEFMRF